MHDRPVPDVEIGQRHPMSTRDTDIRGTDPIVIVGAGIGGLSAALRLAHAGHRVEVIEAQPTPGGKMRTVPTAAGPADTGPTVLTLRPVFEDLFADVGERLDDHVTLIPLTTLARHFWSDGTQFDLTADPEQSAAIIGDAFGSRAQADYRAFAARARRLFDAFDAPMLQSPRPSQLGLAGRVLRQPRLIADMAPHRSLAGLLKGAFREPKLAQLFGRYATYVGGGPQAAPALLSLIAHAEARGVWAVTGGMHRLAQVIAGLAQARGAVFRYDTRVERIDIRRGAVRGVATSRGDVRARAVLFNGDPRALHQGLLGGAATGTVPASAVEPRSLSAWVHAFAATPSGPGLAYHNVFFGDDPGAEFADLARGKRPTDATLYICAQDRAAKPIAQDRAGTPPSDTPERFEIILNGAPLAADTAFSDTAKDIARCQDQIFTRLRTFGLTFSPHPGPATLTTPAMFAQSYPGSLGSLYGRSPRGLTAGLKRPLARTNVTGLYLCGGGAHPGAGVPMAALSARHAAEAIATDLALPSPSRPTAMPGGTSTA